VARAKQLVSRYCWGTSKIDDYSDPQLMRRSVLSNRREAGNSLVIYGEAGYGRASRAKSEEPGGGYDVNVQVKKKPIGRTLLASLVMKEVIRQRAFPGHAAETYEWTSFTTLKSRVVNGDKEAISDYQTCDWLVVDGVHQMEHSTQGSKAYVFDKIDSVFGERLANELPTIIVFQFNIEKFPDLESEIGVSMAEIALHDRTCRVNLSQGGKKK
jgi:hypothetical protein